MNTGIEINNKGIKFAISNFKLENGLYFNPDIRREWTIARDLMASVERINPIKGYTLSQDAFALQQYTELFEKLTMMHENDVYDALYVAAKRYHKAA